MEEQTEIPEVAAMPRSRPDKFKKHHRWPVAWKARNWCVDFIYDRWPRNA